jgi:segregation and condensation protein A
MSETDTNEEAGKTAEGEPNQVVDANPAADAIPAEATMAEGSAGESSAQGEMPFAIVEGQPMTQLPLDLYIPPDALEVVLEAFEGPLDLLLYLIKRQNLDILDIRVAEITKQYMDYIEFMKDMQLELAAEYLVMAAVLAEIKSRMLLPRHEEDEEDEDDPRAELIRRLQEYERFKQAALDIDELQRRDRDYWVGAADVPKIEKEKPLPDVHLQEMLVVLAKVLKRAETFTSHKIELEPLSTRERMSSILDRVQKAGDQFVPFISLFDPEEGKAGVVVTFLAMMELIKESLLDIVQAEAFGPIHVKTRGEDTSATEPEQI